MKMIARLRDYKPYLATATIATLVTAGCGQPAASQLKIRNGKNVAKSSTGPERLSTVGLRGDTLAGSYTCSAAIIGDDLLVTAAHCVQADAQLYAYFGTDMRRASASEFIAISNALVDPRFDISNAEGGGLPPDDVAVLKLSTQVPAGFVPAPILTDDAALSAGDTVTLAGYGITEIGGDSGRLRFTTTTFDGLDDFGRLKINDAAKRGACSGDSGGPFFANIGGVAYVAGVLSGGPIPCRGINIYTSLAGHRTFIDEATISLGG